MHRSIMGVVLAAVLVLLSAGTAQAAVAPVIWSFQPQANASVSPGNTLLIDFSQPMDQSTVLVQLDPPTEFWWYWDTPTQLVVLPKQRFNAAAVYHATVSGRSVSGTALIGPNQFQFQTGPGPSLGSGTNVLLYHITGRPRTGDLPDNFVSMDTFVLQLAELRSRGYTFGMLESGCTGWVVCLTFDDGWATQYNVAAYLRSQGIPAIFFITLGNLDRSAFLSSWQVQNMAKWGMTIGSHLLQHDCLTATAFKMPLEQRDNYLLGQIGSSKQYLESLIGQPVSWLAYPFGCYDWTVIRMAQRFYRSAYTTDRTMPLAPGMEPFAQLRTVVRESTRF